MTKRENWIRETALFQMIARGGKPADSDEELGRMWDKMEAEYLEERKRRK